MFWNSCYPNVNLPATSVAEFSGTAAGDAIGTVSAAGADAAAAAGNKVQPLHKCMHNSHTFWHLSFLNLAFRSIC